MFSTISILLLCLTQQYLGYELLYQPIEENLKFKNLSVYDYEETTVVNAKHSFVANVDDDKIVFRVSGKIANYGEVPYQVALMKGWLGKFTAFCGGTIVDPKKIITSAHCVVSKLNICFKGDLSRRELKRISLVAGQLKTVTRFRAQGQWRTPFKGKYPKTYKFPKDDIAVLYIRRPWMFDNTVQYIPFATKNEDYDLTCTASGFGTIDKKTRASELRVAQLKLLSKSKCNRIHHRDFSNLICASDQVSDVYKGDSGGPLVCVGTTDPKESKLGILVGVVSGKDSVKKMGSFFTRVSSYEKLLNCSSKPEITSCLIGFILFWDYYIALSYSFNLFYSIR